jgi:hypothetical protein
MERRAGERVEKRRVKTAPRALRRQPDRWIGRATNRTLATTPVNPIQHVPPKRMSLGNLWMIKVILR